MTIPEAIKKTGLWNRTLGNEVGDDGVLGARERLRNVFMGFRSRVALLAAEIHTVLPEYTVHDITHLDALWEMADIIAGDKFLLNPTEGFVLGGAILLHDLGMGLASYPRGIEEIRSEETWADIITENFQKQFHRLPTANEILEPPEEIKRQGLGFMLRTLHAKHAEHLASIPWRAKPEEPEHFLIDDNEIRQEFGRTIGLIAHSHWWPVSRLESEFSRTLGAPYWCPSEWTVDPLKIACLLRVADASHIDARRAPSFLRALRKPSAYSDMHWNFQEKLQKPYLADDALAYTSGHAFPLKDASSWWLCLDTLSMIDRELRQVDALLADKGLLRFAARRVAGVESPERLVSYIPTDGWFPVNAIVQVSDVPKLIKSLGGEELYGNNPTVPLRELIQNSSDAIKVRRIVESRDEKWGDIHVRLGTDNSGEWLEVEDNGIGMSSEVLTRYLLDFGNSYWGSNLMLEEYPGLLAKGIKPTGKYGIGFFSIFMLGSAVRIRTRRAEAAQNETLVLEFNTGVSSRPILRPATKEERIRDGGTCIRVWLEKPATQPDGLLARYGDNPPYTLDQLCRIMCPSLDVNITTYQNNKSVRVVYSSDWIDAPALDFFQKLRNEHDSPDYNSESCKEFISRASANLRLLRNEDGEIVGRACIARERYFGQRSPVETPQLLGAVTIGGLYACSLTGIAGILIGTSERAARDSARPLISAKVLSSWASEQADLVPNLYEQLEHQESCARIIRKCGGETKRLPIAKDSHGWVNYSDIAQKKDLSDEIILVDTYYVEELQERVRGFRLAPNVLITEHSGWSAILNSRYSNRWPQELFIGSEEKLIDFMATLGGAVLEAASEAWNVPIEAIVKSSHIGYRNKVERVIGYINDDDIIRLVFVICRPS